VDIEDNTGHISESIGLRDKVVWRKVLCCNHFLLDTENNIPNQESLPQLPQDNLMELVDNPPKSSQGYFGKKGNILQHELWS